ncbi:hypothetical protein M9458_026891, partial [Cirrhinus mrigala]
MQQCFDNGCKVEQVITPNAERVISSRDNSRNDAADTYETGIMHKHGVPERDDGGRAG